MPYKPGAGGSFPLQTGKGPYLCKSGEMDPLVCGSAVDRDIPLGWMFSKSRRSRSWEILEPVECSSKHGMTSTWPSSTHFSPGVEYTYAAKDGKLGSSFLTWFPTPSFQICCTCKKSLCRLNQFVLPFFPSQLSLRTSLTVWCGKEAGARMAFSTIPAYTDAEFIVHTILKTVLRLPYLRVRKKA